MENQRHLRTPRRALPNEDEEDEIADGLSSSPLSGQPNGHDSSQRGRLRLRKRIDYAEDDEDYVDEDEDEDDVDELLMGAEVRIFIVLAFSPSLICWYDILGQP